MFGARLLLGVCPHSSCASSGQRAPRLGVSCFTRLKTTDCTNLVDPCCDPKLPIRIEKGAITEAAYGIQGAVERTPCRFSRSLSDLTGMYVYLKMEQTQVVRAAWREPLQATGSFKERGACWALMNLSDEERRKGVYAASAGNHAQALCIHGRQLGIPVTVVMPRHAPIKKIAECRQLGGNIIVQGKDMMESRTIALQKSFDNGGKYLNGYDNAHVIAGAGTVGLEIVEQVPDAAAVVVAVGGGGLVAGVATAIKGLRPSTEIIAVEADSCPSFSRALEHGAPIFTPVKPTLADGLAVPILGVNAFATAKGRVDEAVVVDEKLIGLAILRLVESEKVVTEGAGACSLAALLSGKLRRFSGQKVVAVLSGGNIDTTQLGRVLERGMAWDNRLIKLVVNVSDRPGGIAELTGIVAQQGASIKNMLLERSWSRSDVFTIEAETRNCKHAEELTKALTDRFSLTAFDSTF